MHLTERIQLAIEALLYLSITEEGSIRPRESIRGA